jgi:hypothetical protein
MKLAFSTPSNSGVTCTKDSDHLLSNPFHISRPSLTILQLGVRLLLVAMAVLVFVTQNISVS